MKELKDRLSEYLRRVRAGEIVTITDRGKPVAILCPVGLPQHIREMLMDGRATWSGKTGPLDLEPVNVPPGFSIADYISEDRR